MNKCISRKDYLKKYNSNVGYALYVQDNIKKDDYARLNIGEIVKVIGIRENKVNKKAIYYNIANEDWFDASAVENFSEDIIDLIEIGDIVDKSEVYEVGQSDDGQKWVHTYNGKLYYENELLEKTILTHEQYEQNCYTVERK